MISIIMGVYNEKSVWIQQTVESVLSQTYTDFEFIIIIDNPFLACDAVEYLRKTADADPRVRLHFNERNLGLMRSLNIGIDIAQGDYIARMDADDIPFPDWLEKEMRFMEDNGYDIVSGCGVDIDEEGNEICRSKILKNIPEKHLMYGNFIIHSTIIAKTSMMRELGGYREFYKVEDYDMWLRVLSAGYKMGVLDDYVIFHRIRKGMTHQNRLETYYIAEYQKRLYRERLRNGTDSFSVENLKSYMDSKDISEKRNLQYCNLHESIDSAISKFKSRRIGFIVDLIKAFFAFPSIAIVTIKGLVRMNFS